MPHREKPRVHARDHEHGGADPQRIHYEDVGGAGDGGGGAAFAPYASGTDEVLSLSSGTSGNLNFTNTHSSGVSISGTHITIVTAGTYEVFAAGLGLVTGPTTSTVTLDIQLLVNGLQPTPTSFTEGEFPDTIASGKHWVFSMTLLEQIALDSGDVLTFQATNGTSVSATFGQWRAVVKQLE